MHGRGAPLFFAELEIVYGLVAEVVALLLLGGLLALLLPLGRFLVKFAGKCPLLAGGELTIQSGFSRRTFLAWT